MTTSDISNTISLNKTSIRSRIPIIRNIKFEYIKENLQNIWIWNLILSNSIIVFIFVYLIGNSLSRLPSNIGINTDNNLIFDTSLNQKFIYIPVVLHGIIILSGIISFILPTRKWNHIYIIFSLCFIVISFFELLSINRIINYFIK